MEPTRPDRNFSGSLSRRGFLHATGYLGAGAAVLGLGACGGDDAANPAAAGGGDVGKFAIPDPSGKFPRGKTSFRLLDSGDTKVPYWKAFFDAYGKKHENIEHKYDGLPWNRIEEVLPLGIRNGSAHDAFQLPESIPLSKAVANGWVAPMDDVVPDFENWKKRFPKETLVEGVQIFDGKLYQVPLGSDRRYQALLHYNKKLMDDAGFDPQSEPFTWDTYRQAARTITKKNDGRAYGVILEVNQPGRLEIWVNYMARMAGAANIGGVDPKTGEFMYTKQEVVDAIELLLALKKDGSIFPGSSSLTAPESWPRVVRGNAGMVSAGPWVTVLWETEEKGFDFGVAPQPAPNANPLPIGYPAASVADTLSIYAKSKAKEVAGDVLSYVTSDDGQQRWGEIVGIGNPPIMEKARKRISSEHSAQAKKAEELAGQMVINPDPVIANPGVSTVTELQKTLSPNFGELIQAIFVGEVTDVKKGLQDLADNHNKLRDEAIKAAAKRGVKVSREDWVFKNWEPTKDYTLDDYKAR